LLLCALSCGKTGDATSNEALIEKTHFNVAYGTDVKQKIDLYLPADRSVGTTKVIFLIHGGGWSTGDKSDLTPFVDTLKKRLPGYAIININYRLNSGALNRFPAQELDVKAAIDFVYSKRDDYGLSDKFVLLGASAGAHLALLHSYKNETPVRIQAVIDMFGPADLGEMYHNPASPLAPPSMLASVLGGTPASNPSIYQASSPIHFVNSQTPPTIIFHGGMDPLVATSQAVALKTRLEANGVTNKYVLYPTESHGWLGTNLSHTFGEIQAFLNTHVL
jgi:acetyl esterase/lipase